MHLVLNVFKILNIFRTKCTFYKKSQTKVTVHFVLTWKIVKTLHLHFSNIAYNPKLYHHSYLKYF